MNGTGSMRGPGRGGPWRALAIGAGAAVLLAGAFGLSVLLTPHPKPAARPPAAIASALPRALDLPRVSFPTPRGAPSDPDDPTAWMKNPAYVEQLKKMTLRIADADARAIRTLPYFDEVRAAVDTAYNEGVFNNYSPSLLGDDLWSIVNGDLYRQDGKTRVIDASAVSGLANYSFDNFMPSPDGSHVGFVVSDAGTEFGYARVYDVASGQVLPQVYGPLIGDGSFDWIDDTTFAYTRTPTTDLKSGDPSANNVSYIAKLGQPGPGKPILGAGVGSIPMEGRFTPALWGARSNSDIALGVIFGVSTAEFWLTPRASLVAGAPQWTRLASFDDDVDDATPFFNHVILVRPGKDDLPQLAAYDVASKQTRVIREGSRDLIWTSSWASDHIAYVFARSGAQVRLFQLDSALNLKEIKLPFEGALSEFSGVYGRADELTFKLSSINEPEHFIRVRNGAAETIEADVVLVATGRRHESADDRRRARRSRRAPRYAHAAARLWRLRHGGDGRALARCLAVGEAGRRRRQLPCPRRRLLRQGLARRRQGPRQDQIARGPSRLRAAPDRHWSRKAMVAGARRRQCGRHGGGPGGDAPA
jgi:hypothetical protein